MGNKKSQDESVKSTISALSNPFSTGDGGGDFEHRVQAAFLLGLLVKSFSPILNEPITAVVFQTKRIGCDTDDIMVLSTSESHSAKLLCQIKHGIELTENQTFKKVIAAAWNDYNKPDFNRQTDKIALITNSGVKTNALRFIHDQANAASGEIDFLDRINRSQYSNEDNRNVLKIIRHNIETSFRCVVTDKDLWSFCKAFTVLTFDLDYESSVNEYLIYGLLASNCKEDAISVWAKLVDFAARNDKSDAHVTPEVIPGYIKKSFSNILINDTSPLIPNNSVNPFWAKLALIGSWDEENENDKKLLESFFDSKYSEIQNKVQEYYAQPNANLSYCDGIWEVKHRSSMIHACTSLYVDSHIKRLFALSTDVFSETNKRIQPDGTFNILIPSNGSFRYSESLRNGLLHGLAQICNTLGEKAPCTNRLIEEESWKFVRSILGGSGNTIWMSLDSDLPVIAEINPDGFLFFLGKRIANSPDNIEALFPKASDNVLFSHNYICSILWSLEGLAWSEKYLIKSISLLGQLAALNYEKTNSINTPINSIVSILLPWHIQTFASKEKQQNAIKALQEECPDVAWEVIVNLLPHATRYTSETHRPKYILSGIPENISLSVEDIDEQYAYYSNLALDIAKKDYAKMRVLLSHCNEMDRAVFENFLKLVLEQSSTWNDIQKYPFWNELQNQKTFVTRKSYKDVDISLLESAIERTYPSDIRCRYRRLYDSFYVVDDDEKDSDHKWEKKRAKQETAVYEIYASFGIDAVFQFGKDVGNIPSVAHCLGKHLTKEEINLFLSSCYEQKLDRDFFASVVNGFVIQNGYDYLLQIDFSSCSADFTSWLLTQLQPSMQLFEIANNILTQNVKLFWQSIRVPRLGFLPEIDPNYVWKRLTEQERFVSAVNLFEYSSEQCSIQDEEIHHVLCQAATTECRETMEPDAVRNLIELLQQNRKISIADISDVELIYLPLLDRYSKVRPKALWYRLANEPEFFCELVELHYKKRHSEKHGTVLSENISRRLGEIFFHYCVVPGTDWDGNSDEKAFRGWVDYCKKWGREEDRIDVVLQTIGSGLSYATINENGLPDEFIMKELNRFDNEQMRNGYHCGIINQRGVTFVDPEGKPEYELAEKFEKMANKAEDLGYANYAETLRHIAIDYVEQANRNIQECKREQEFESIDE